MRLLIMAMLLLIVPGLAVGQGEPVSRPTSEAAWGESHEEPVEAAPSTTLSGPAGETQLAPVMAENGDSGAAVAQPTMSGFLYQVLLAAVTALVTALIWKAVF